MATAALALAVAVARHVAFAVAAQQPERLDFGRRRPAQASTYEHFFFRFFAHVAFLVSEDSFGSGKRERLMGAPAKPGDVVGSPPHSPSPRRSTLYLLHPRPPPLYHDDAPAASQMDALVNDDMT